MNSLISHYCFGQFNNLLTSSLYLINDHFFIDLIFFWPPPCTMQEGLGALWTGLGPNVARNAIINAAELASYDQVKQVSTSVTFD